MPKYEIPVFQSEIQDGIADKVRASASIAYFVGLEPMLVSDEWLQKVQASLASKALAGVHDTDLYPIKSILVSTNWNKNDDIFDPREVWAARHTPAHKPTNINHNEKLIVGHMIDSWAVSAEGGIIPDNSALDDLPSLYHLANSAVIYKKWVDPEFQAQVNDLIEKIEANKKFVSMECLFAGFDYGMIGPDGTAKVVARNHETAFLTKHLRIYGGVGSYDNHKVGRVLRRMTFSAKGYVDNPANEQSVILTHAENSQNSPRLFATSGHIEQTFDKSGVLINCNASPNNMEIDTMAEVTTNALETQLADLKAELKAVKDENKVLAEKSTKAHVDSLQEQVKDLTAKLTEANTKVAETTEANTKFSKQVEDLTKSNSDLTAEFDKIKAETAKSNRVNMLVSGGLTKEAAVAMVEKFLALTDEQFGAVADLAISAAKKPDATPDKTKTKVDADLNSAEKTDEPALSTAGTDEEADKSEAREKLNKSVAEYFAARLSKTE